MANNDIIDMSQIAPPDAVQVPLFNDIFSNWLDKLQKLDPEFDALLESDPTFKQGEAFSYRVMVLYQIFNERVLAVMLATAAKNDLDQIGINFNVKRFILQQEDLTTIPPTPALFEEDNDYRKRIQLSWARLSTAGPRSSYIYHTISSSSKIISADAVGPETHNKPGHVEIYILSSDSEDGKPSDDTIKIAENALNDREVRPLTDYVTVKSAHIHHYQTVALLEIPEGPDRETIYSEALKSLAKYVEYNREIGLKLSFSGLYKSLHVSGVKDVLLKEPINSLPAIYGVSYYCDAIDIKYVDSIDEEEAKE